MKRFPWINIGMFCIASCTLLPQLISQSANMQSAWTVRTPEVFSGDEPHYLAIINSVISDGDLDLANNYTSSHSGGLDAGNRHSRFPLDHHVAWYVDGDYVRWDELYVGWGGNWTHDLRGNPQPTLLGKTAAPHITKFEYSYHPSGLGILLAPILLPLAKTRMVEAGAIAMCWLASIVAMHAFVGLCQRYTQDRKRILLVTCIAFLGSPVWHYSRALFTEIFLLAFALLAYRIFLSERHHLLGGLLLALGSLLKPPFVLLAIPPLISLFAQKKQKEIVFVLLPISAGICVNLVMNSFMYGNMIHGPQPWRSGNLYDGAIGLLFSTSHGILPFSPVLLVAWNRWPTFLERFPRDGWILLGGFGIYFFLMSLWQEWEGGFCYGPRLVLPVLLFLIPPLLVGNWSIRSAHGLVTWTLVVISITTNCLGAIRYSNYWDRHPLIEILRSYGSYP